MRNFIMGIIVFLIILFCIWIQINVLNIIPLYGIKANIGIVFVVALSILCGQAIGISVGTLYGLLLDILFGKSIGVYMLLFFGIGLFCGMMSKSFSKDNKNAIMIISFGTTIVFEIISYILFMLIYDYELEIFSILKVLVLEGVYNMILTRILFSSLAWIAELINKGKRSYYLL